MLTLLKLKLPETLRAVAPLVIVVTALQLTLVGASAELFLRFLAGAALVTVGMVLLLTGVDFGILPMGRYIGAELPKTNSLWLVLGAAFALGFATTAAEPDVLVLATQVEGASRGALTARPLVYLVSTGVGLFVTLALLRVLRGFSMTWLLTGVYSTALVLTLIAPAHIIPLAYDAGSVTTGVLTTPVVLALAMGVSAVLSGRSAVNDGFGLLGMAAAGPIIVMLLAGLFLS